MIHHKNQAFSLIEVMIVIVIVGILASIAIPSYNTYILKSKAMEAISLLRSFAKQYEEQYSTTGSFYTGALTGLYSYPTGNVETISIGSFGTGNMMYILATFRNNAGFGSTSKRIVLRLDAEPGSNVITRYCGQWTSTGNIYVPVEYLPTSCNTINISSIPSP